MTFSELNIPKDLICALTERGIYNPTEVQAKSYKHICQGRDMIVSSSTGTGKTLAYLLPVLERIDITSKSVQLLVLVPTQELAIQVCEQAQMLLDSLESKASSLFLIGEGNINRQADALKEKPVIVAGTPSRVAQLIKMKKLKVHDVKTLVLDEADKLMDKTYYETVLSIRKSLMKRTQVLLFSASIDKKTIKLANDLAFKAIVMNTTADSKDTTSLIPKSIKHIYIVTDRRERIETMRKIAKALNKDKTIVFINTKYDLDESLQKLLYHHYNAAALAGNIDKQAKKKALNGFKEGRINYLLCTDVAARGLQIDNIDTVINVNLPEDETEYLHRAGRCGRNGNEGLCVSIITENELDKIKKYQKKFNINIVQKRLYNGKLVAR